MSAIERRQAATLPTLDCDDCGKALKTLTPEEAQREALDPYAFIVYCRRCGADRERALNGRSTGADR